MNSISECDEQPQTWSGRFFDALLISAFCLFAGYLMYRLGPTARELLRLDTVHRIEQMRLR